MTERTLITNVNIASFNKVFEPEACNQVIQDLKQLPIDIDINTAIYWMGNLCFKASARPIIEYLLYHKQWINNYNTSAKRLITIVEQMAFAAMNDLIPIFLDQIIFNVQNVVVDALIKWFMNEVETNARWLNLVDDDPMIQIFMVLLRKRPDLFDVNHFELGTELGMFIMEGVYTHMDTYSGHDLKTKENIRNFLKRVDQKWDNQIQSLTEKRNRIQSILAEEVLQTGGL